MACGCGAKRSGERGSKALRSTRPSAPTPPSAQRSTTFWIATPPEGDPVTLYTLQDVRRWRSSHSDWTVERVRS